MVPGALQFIAIFALTILTPALAFDPDPLQDFCVGDPNSNVFINGMVCKNPSRVTPDDFVLSGIDRPGNTNNGVGSNVTQVNDSRFPGLNTLGISLARIDYGPYGQNPPHIHPRATEVLTVLQGTLFAGFVTPNPNKLFARILKTGDVIVFPFAHIHFQQNIGAEPAVALSHLSSQNPGVITIANATFGSNPRIPEFVLEKGFQVDKKVIQELMAQFMSMS